MKFRSTARQVSRLLQSSSLKPHHSQSPWYRFQSHNFSSNLDNDKENLSPIKKVSKIQESIHENLKQTMSDSFWSFTAVDSEHKQWIAEYNKELTKNNSTYFELKSFKDISKWMGYIGSIGYDAIHRFRMRPLKANLICYEEFMIGALRSFQSIQNMDHQNKISRCFAEPLWNQMAEIKNALFDTEHDIYRIPSVTPLAHSLCFVQPSSDSHEIEMRFNVRYYYSLQSVANEEDTKRKYADIEWMGVLQPEIEDNKFKKMNLSDEGFLIRDIEVDSL